jgi:GR25 family glycosyltransferase involved in LPS biosynthesis
MFTKILYINLDRRTDRNTHVLDQLKKINWDGEVERISAVDGRVISINSFSHLLTPSASQQANDTTARKFAPGSYMTKGSVGCALSHYNAWINIRNGNHDNVLIIEDDIFFDADFNNKLASYITLIPDYDILYLGYHESKNPYQINKYFSRPDGIVFGTYAMLINKKAINKIMNLFPIDGQIDSQLFNIYDKINVYHLNKDNIIVHGEHSFVNSFGSDIQIIEGFGNSYTSYLSTFILVLAIIILIFLLYIAFNAKKNKLVKL